MAGWVKCITKVIRSVKVHVSLMPDHLSRRTSLTQEPAATNIHNNNSEWRAVKQHAYLAHILIWKLLSLAYLMVHLMTTTYIYIYWPGWSGNQIYPASIYTHVHCFQYTVHTVGGFESGTKTRTWFGTNMLWIGTGMEFTTTLLHHSKNSVI